MHTDIVSSIILKYKIWAILLWVSFYLYYPASLKITGYYKRACLKHIILVHE